MLAAVPHRSAPTPARGAQRSSFSARQVFWRVPVMAGERSWHMGSPVPGGPPVTVRLLTNIGRLWTGSEILSNAAIVTGDDRIAWVGPAAELPQRIPGRRRRHRRRGSRGEPGRRPGHARADRRPYPPGVRGQPLGRARHAVQRLVDRGDQRRGRRGRPPPSPSPGAPTRGRCATGCASGWAAGCGPGPPPSRPRPGTT